MTTVSIKPGDNWKLLRSLEENDLVPSDVLGQLREKMDGEDISSWLVEQGWLTHYQLRRIAAGQSKSLLLGQYRILEELGHGGFGQVYKAVHVLMNRIVALKVIAPQWVEDSGVRELFLREVMASTRLVHPNIALAYDANEIDDILYLAMEFVDGLSLEQLVTNRGPLRIPLACAIMLQAAQALQFAHEAGMVHRDIKPANLLLPGARHALDPLAASSGLPSVLVKVVDFGLARLYPPGTPQSFTIRTSGEILGTPEYMSPEQARDYHQVDIRSDLYSLGCTFYFALAGRPPFDGSSGIETIAMQLEREPEDLRSRRLGVPSDVAAIVRRLMAKRPEERFQTPAELVEPLSLAMRNLLLKDVAGLGVSQGSSQDPPVVALSPVGRIANPSHNGESHNGDAVCAPVQEDGESQQKVTHAEERVNPALPSEILPTDSVRSLWREWCAGVQGFALGKPAGIDDRYYKALHRALLKSLHDQENPPANASPELIACLQSLVEPWLTLHSFANLDRKTLAGLWQTCLELDAKLMPSRIGTLPNYGMWSLVCIFVLGLVAGSLFFFRTVPSSATDLLASGIESHPLVVIGLSVPLLILGMIVFFLRRPGS